MRERTRIIVFAIAIMAAASLLVAGVTQYSLYRAAFAEETARLVEAVKNQARLMEAIARFSAQRNHDAQEGEAADSAEATLEQMVDAHQYYEGFGQTGEFALARRDGDAIVFLLSHRHFDLDDPKPVPFKSHLAEPMRRALLGGSGSLVGPDYRGQRVLAAYEPVDGLGWGIVAKIDLAEIRAPFIRAGTIAGLIALAVIVVGAAFSVRVTNPLLSRLEESEARNRVVLASTPDPVVTVDSYGTIQSASDSVERVLGWTPSELIGRNVNLLMDEPHQSEHHAHLANYRRTGRSDIFGRTRTFEARHKDGSTVQIELSVARVDIPGKKQPLFTGIIHDITERKRAEDAVRRSEERFRKVFDHSNDAIFVIDPVTDAILDANPTACAMLQYTREELLSVPISAVHPNEMPQLRAFAKSVFHEGHGWTDELTCFTKSGATLPAEISASVFDFAGRKCILALVRDITERKQAERALKESEERLSQILGSAMDAIVTVDEHLVIRMFNAAAEKVFRCKAVEAVQQPFDRFASEALRELLVRSMSACEAGDSDSCLVWAPEGLTALRADGEMFPLEATISRSEAAGEKLYTIILRDVNERVRAEERLHSLRLENVYLREEVGAEVEFEEIVGSSPSIRKVLESVKQVAGTDSTVLITGETGTGKELIARAIHNLSGRKDKVLVTVNCAALPAGLIESELFGHEKGAFTGATSQKAGRFELADGGTIFLDEIGDLPLELQSKLLRVLQEGEFERVGGSKTLKVDVRIVAATNQDPAKAVAEERFRSDLYYRLNIFPIRLPPLRDRKSDIPSLVRHLTMKCATKMAKRIDTIPNATMQALIAYPWPGNVRELENVIERGVILTNGEHLKLGDWLPKPTVATDGSPLVTLEESERQHIQRVLELANWQVRGARGAAEILGLKPTTLESRMKRLGIVRKQ